SSMGGSGALRIGLKYGERFGKIVSLSAAMMLYDLDQRTDDHPMFMERRCFAQEMFGDFDKVMESDKNPVWLLCQRKAEGKEIPEIYQAVGTEDFLLEPNRRLHQELLDASAEVTYVEATGGHEWGFWRNQLPEILDWLPLADASVGINSGNIGVE
ncbi:MAG: acetylesterase, partial [Clostridiales bacterium]|nr:acetylesterase [Clostridiales bacterium]